MNRDELLGFIDKTLAGLKDFQAASVDALYEGLYDNGRPRMLLADEVGLGKTVVARGLIARLLKQRITGGKRKPLKVTYICSNQVIAKENLRKLNPFPSTVAMAQPVSRIAYLAYEAAERRGSQQNLLELNTLTPATSFQIGSGIGNKWERRAIYAVLCGDRKMRNRRKGLRWLLKGSVRDMATYRKQLDAAREWPLRDQLKERYLAKLKQTDLPLEMEAVYREIPGKGKRSIYDAMVAFLEILDGRSRKRLRPGCHQLTKLLREHLVDCCLPYVDADLYILDEFQRFRDLIDETSEEEQAFIARKVFRHRKNSRVLLLSATPFKAFTGHEEIERGEDHFKDFGKVLRFLLGHDEERILHYEKHRKELYGQILDLRSGELAQVPSTHRDEVESVLRAVICRTERHSVASDPNALIEDVWKRPDQEVPFGAGDIENFRSTDRLARALARTGCPTGKPVDYCKSALFPLSFLDRYKLKEELKARRAHPEVQLALLQSPHAWLDLDGIDRYEWSLGATGQGSANARLSMLLEHAVGPHGAKLLWVPPSLPYYDLEDAFAGAVGFSKTLLFSSWIMVPRMVSTLISYEVERQTIGNSLTVDDQEAETRTYFTPEGKKRHPTPQIRYARRTHGNQKQLANMSNFTLLYPSQVLAEIVDPLRNLREGLSLEELRSRVAGEIEALLNASGCLDHATPEGESDRWYWAAPLLLDHVTAGHRKAALNWFGTPRTWGASTDDGAGETEEQSGAKQEHFEYLRECFSDPDLIGLGHPPEDLAKVLADLALGSPAVIALRGLRRQFPADDDALQMDRAFSIADQFATLFNKPESIAAVRLSEGHSWYWQMVADYCASGCLQAVLDEYFHLLSGQNASPDDVVSQLVAAINLNASTINVDSLETFQSGKPRKLRCHYAVEFGSQRVETDQGQKRASSLRELFNSPFRPFVLSTTSIGQEGLDFHSYCRRIVHWNLPGNPVDLEQREGRINRYKSLVIRQQLGKKYRSALAEAPTLDAGDPWESLFRLADAEERLKAGKCELVPYWHVDGDNTVKIERVIPLYPYSIDRGRLLHILKTLAIYRLAFGQPRQAELVDHLLDRNLTEEEQEKVKTALMIDLSPIRYRRRVPPP
jgi:hypothetical protein